MKSRLSLQEIQQKIADIEERRGEVLKSLKDRIVLHAGTELAVFFTQRHQKHAGHYARLIGYWQWRERVYFERFKTQ